VHLNKHSAGYTTGRRRRPEKHRVFIFCVAAPGTGQAIDTQLFTLHSTAVSQLRGLTGVVAVLRTR